MNFSLSGRSPDPRGWLWVFHNTDDRKSASVVLGLLFNFETKRWSGTKRFRTSNYRKGPKEKAANASEIRLMRQLLPPEEVARVTRELFHRSFR